MAAVLLFALAAPGWGSDLAGLWQEYDDKTGKVEALIRIEQATDGSYEGKIVKLMADVVGKDAQICSKCKGSLRNQPLLGMRILSGMKRKDQLNFDGGEILDPEDGTVYRCHIRLSEDGKTMEVTGYIGFNWLGQSETWRRTE